MGVEDGAGQGLRAGNKGQGWDEEEEGWPWVVVLWKGWWRSEVEAEGEVQLESNMWLKVDGTVQVEQRAIVSKEVKGEVELKLQLPFIRFRVRQAPMVHRSPSCVSSSGVLNFPHHQLSI